MTTLDLGILVSGSGTNLQAILDAVAEGRLDARIRLVVSNVPGVRALERARAAAVPSTVVSHKDFSSREAFDARLASVLREAGVRWVALAGFMRVLSDTFLEHFRDRVLNIHPALLPSFPGIHAQRQALEYGAKLTGCTVHFVDAGVDTGPIILQRAVPILDTDDESTLSARILVEEHRAYVEALTLLSTERVRLVPGTNSKRTRVVVLPS